MTTPLEEYSNFKEEEGLYYYLTILSLLEGVSVYELDLELKFQEKLENYEACAGIKKAIDEADYRTYKELKLIASELDDKYNF
jgi:hypothetical protein